MWASLCTLDSVLQMLGVSLLVMGWGDSWGFPAQQALLVFGRHKVRAALHAWRLFLNLEVFYLGHFLRTSLKELFGLPWWLSCKESSYQCRRCGFNPWVGKIPWRRKWQPTPVSLPGKSHGQRSLVGYSPRGHKESDTTERLNNNERSFLSIL